MDSVSNFRGTCQQYTKCYKKNMKNPYETPTEEKINRTQKIPLEKLGKFTEQVRETNSS